KRVRARAVTRCDAVARSASRQWRARTSCDVTSCMHERKLKMHDEIRVFATHLRVLRRLRAKTFRAACVAFRVDTVRDAQISARKKFCTDGGAQGAQTA